MLSNALEHISQIRFWIEAVEFRRADERVDGSGSLAAGIRAGEQMVLAPERDRAQRTLGGIVVDFCAPIIAIATQRLPARERVVDRARKIRLLRELADRALTPKPYSDTSAEHTNG